MGLCFGLILELGLVWNCELRVFVNLGSCIFFAIGWFKVDFEVFNFGFLWNRCFG